jgi:Tol biopolymer transport system component
VTLVVGSSVGPYHVVAPLGRGGMGEVYRARDAKLNRDVALKVLPEAFASDPDRLARFQREAQLLASLNHPNIAAIYGLEEAGGIRALVLELVEGPTLANRIAAGAIPIDDALPIARQIADALEAAHEQGIVHRDLKPANVKVRPDGTSKVLDFGLGKMLDTGSDGSGGSSGSAGFDASASPTITTPAMTQLGVILGTAAYMSPEQAKGRGVDRRSDIWAFGCVLYEMLAGSRAFGGEDVAETLAFIITRQPDWTKLPHGAPANIVRVIRRCLEKDPKRRLRDIADARLDLDAAHETPAALPLGAPHGRTRRERLLWGTALAVATLAAAAAIVSRTGSAVPGAPEMRLDISTPPTADPVSIAISPDGQKVVFAASSKGRPQLWLRSLDSPTARPLRGTEGAIYPFWSPDSRSIGFFANERLNRIDADGGGLKALTGAPVGAGGAWSRDGVIIFPIVPDAPLYRVSENGGPPALVPGSGDLRDQPGQRFPQFLPDGRHFVYYTAESRGVFLGQLDAPGRRRLLDADAAAVFAPPDQLLYVREARLFAQRFDPVRLEIIGEPVSVADQVTGDARGMAAVAASAVGSIAYRTGTTILPRRLAWFDRSGKEIGAIGEPDTHYPMNPSLSPDGRRVALTRSFDGNTDVWLVELDRGVLSRFTFDPLPEIYPQWSPDGRRIVYGKPTKSGFVVFQKPVSKEGQESVLFGASDASQAIPVDWSSDGRLLLCRTGDPQGWDLVVVPIDGHDKPYTAVHSAFSVGEGQFSPDGHWIVYESSESGRYEIFVQPVQGSGVKSQVSTGGGLQVRWRADGREIFYVAPDGRLMAVPVSFTANGQEIALGTAVPLFMTQIESTRTGGLAHAYAASPDGQRFLMSTFTEQNGSPITLILNRKGR